MTGHRSLGNALGSSESRVWCIHLKLAGCREDRCAGQRARRHGSSTFRDLSATHFNHLTDFQNPIHCIQHVTVLRTVKSVTYCSFLNKVRPRSIAATPLAAYCNRTLPLSLNTTQSPRTAMLFCGSIISAVHGNAFSAYCNESEVFPKVFTGNLLRLRSEQTAKLLRRPRSAKLWIRRARTHLQLHYPELVISDAHKALAIVSATSTSTDKNDKSRSKAAVLLCQGLLFAQCFQECLDHVQDFRARSRDHGITVLPDYLKELRKVAKYARQCLADVIAQEGDLHATVYGEILAGGYPWLEDHQKRTEETQLDMNEQLLKISDSACEIRKSHGARAVAGNCLGIFARHDIDEDEVIFKERPMLLATDYVDLDCCRFCCAPLDAYEAKPATKGCCK